MKEDVITNDIVAEDPRLQACGEKYGASTGIPNTAAASVGGNVAASGVCQMYSDIGLIGNLVIAEVTCSGQFWFVREY